MFIRQRQILNKVPIFTSYFKIVNESFSGTRFKEASLDQCIIKAMKLNSEIPPLLFGLGVEIDHPIRSKTLLTELSKLGYAISYDEVKRYKKYVLMDEGHKLITPKIYAVCSTQHGP